MGRLSAIPLEPSRFARTLQALDALIADGAAPGAVIGLWESRRSGICRVAARGQRRVVPSPLPLEAETPFDLASLTKVLGTALLVARSVERGLVSWRMPIRALLPGFVGEGVRVDQLLSHSAGQPAWRAFHETLRRELGRGPDQGTRGLERVPVGIRQGLLRRLVLSEPLEARPGERVLYSDLAFLTLGFAMEEAWGLELDRAIEREVWGALRVPGLRFHRVSRSVSGGRLDEVAATEDCP
ncbi:MAG: beta-lactamase family protein, partial [Bdellovibrionales bacterium]|nr:beta-lactamase family protein [Bdellovibrionales bacterium]